MEVKNNMLMAIISGPHAKNVKIGLVANINDNLITLMTNNIGNTINCKKENLFLIAENCATKDFIRLLETPKLAEIIQTFAITAVNLQAGKSLCLFTS